MLESGIRFEHILKILSNWRPSEYLEIPNTGMELKRLECFNDRSFAANIWVFKDLRCPLNGYS